MKQEKYNPWHGLILVSFAFAFAALVLAVGNRRLVLDLANLSGHQTNLLRQLTGIASGQQEYLEKQEILRQGKREVSLLSAIHSELLKDVAKGKK